MKRFYPDSLPPFSNEPSRKKFDIVHVDDLRGEGVVSKAHFRKGEILFAFTGYLVSSITQFSLRLNEETHIHDPYFMGKVLHSCDPNAHCDMQKREFMALRDIYPEELITMDYLQTEDILFKPFKCSCGAAKCRGVIGSPERETAETEVFSASDDLRV